MIGGGRPKISGLAGRVANIVSLNVDNAKGKLGDHSVTTSDAAVTLERIDWVKVGAGDRFDQIELEVGVFFLSVARRPRPPSLKWRHATG